jgi:hypothetical protein
MMHFILDRISLSVGKKTWRHYSKFVLLCSWSEMWEVVFVRSFVCIVNSRNYGFISNKTLGNFAKWCVENLISIQNSYIRFEIPMAVVIINYIFWYISQSPLKVSERSEEIYHLHLQWQNKPSKKSTWRLFCLPPTSTLVSCLVYSYTLKMEAIWSSETLVCFQRTTRCYIQEHSNNRNLNKA